MADRVTRRKFLDHSQTTALGLTGGLAVMTSTRRARAASPTDTIVMGVVGIGGRGGSHVHGFASRDDCRVATLCDVDSRHFEGRNRLLEELQGRKAETVADMRRLFEDPNIDAVVVATPDHWHSLATVWACQAGKDVYVEKPLSNNAWEGRQAVKAARKYQRIVQVGTQNRSAPYNIRAAELIASGKLGDVHLVRVYNQKGHGPADPIPDSPPPPTLDWDIWNGPAPAAAFNPTWYRHWHEFWRYGGGDVTNCGVHQLDLARMLTGVGIPKSVHSVGRSFQDLGRGGVGETPDTVITTFDFDEMVMTFHQTLFTPYIYKTDGGIRNGDMFPYWMQNATRIEIYGTKAMMLMGRHGGGWQVFTNPKSRQPVVTAQEYGRFPDPEHKQNFVEAIRSRELPSADVEVSHLSTLLCHYANASYRAGNQFLEIDPTTEQFVDNPAANALLKPTYRPPYVIPEEV